MEKNSQDITCSTNPPVVLVVHASVGSGHKSAAMAIAQAFELMRGSEGVPENLQVEVLDIFDFGRIRFNGDKLASQFTGSTRPIYDFTWRYFLTGRLLWGGGWSWSRIMFPKFTEYVQQKKPIAIVCTHITAANAAVGARMITGQEFPLVCVPTDYETEGWWPHRATDLFCVATESMAETLRPRKVTEDCIEITGIPTRADFLKEYDRDSVREKYQLPQDKQVVLALAGASMPAPYVLFREILDKLLPYLHTVPNIHMAFLCGNDTEYARHMRRMVEDLRLSNATVLDYVDDMAALMSSCDAVVCKPGGLVVTECLCAKAPIFLLGRAYGQEKINVRMLTACGAALHMTTSRELLETLRLLDEHPEGIRPMLFNGALIRRPDAAHDIVRCTMERVSGAVPCDPARRKHYFAHFYIGGKRAHTC